MRIVELMEFDELAIDFQDMPAPEMRAVQPQYQAADPSCAICGVCHLGATSAESLNQCPKYVIYVKSAARVCALIARV